MGPAGLRKHEMVRHILESEVATREVSPDWCYVYNFSQPDKPNVIELPAGRGIEFCHDMEQLVEDIETTVPAAFEAEEYQARIEELQYEFSTRRDTALEEVSTEAGKRGLGFLHTPSGFAFAPLDKKGEVIDPEEFRKLSEEEQKSIETTVEDLQKQLQGVIRQFPVWQKEAREKVKNIDRENARYAVEHLIASIKHRYADLEEVQGYLDDIEQDIIEHTQQFRQEDQPGSVLFGPPAKDEALGRYKVNLVVDHSDEASPAVVYQDLPTYSNLVGRVEYRAQMGTLVTDYTMIKPGDLHRANGGYLVLDANKVLTQPFAWEGLKRALRARVIRIESLEKAWGMMSTSSLEPEPIPLDVKVVLVGDRRLYYLLNHYDPDFKDLFKVSADFDDSIERDADSARQFAAMVARISREEQLRPLAPEALARVVEQGSRIAGDALKISVSLREIGDLLREANFEAGKDQAEQILSGHVQAAIDAHTFRLDRIRERSYESIERGIIKIDTESEVPGQINGLSVLQIGDFAFGQPSRITVTTRLGAGKVIDIQRETEMGGNIHSKGVLILSNFLASHYARDYPLSVSASIAFEQSYGMVDGDSASLAELCALLSSLSGIPIRQSFAVTGSINQRGEVQAIGGVNQKIEGFFDICSSRGLSGEQAVIIPSTNIDNLMLRKDVVDAAARSEFQVFAVEDVDQAIELLTGVDAGERDQDGAFPPDSVNGRVEQRLIELAVRRREFGRKDDAGEPK
jgi:lon-related putative ATP-dependent protease